MNDRRPKVQYSTRRRRPRWGQHFLADRAVIHRIVEALAPQPGEAVFEIGPGFGVLTEALVERQVRLAAVELDTRLAAELARRLGRNLELFADDVLRLDWSAVYARLGLGEAGRLAVVGNLPYGISKRVVQRLVQERSRVSRAVLMFQKEVAERLTAPAGTPAYGPLAVYAGSAFDIERLFDVGPQAFRPSPRVVSTVTRWRPREVLPDGRMLRALRRCLAACFRQRRRTLWNNLRAAVGEARAERWLARLGLDPARRPATLEPEIYHRLAAFWLEEGLV